MNINFIKNESKKSLKNFWKEIVSFVLIMGLIFFSLSLFMPIKYQSKASILITQKDAFGIDAYKEAKSAEFSGKIISEIILSNSFLEAVLKKNNKASLILAKDNSSQERLEKWRKIVRANQASNTGIINISLEGPSREDSKSVLVSMIEILANDGQAYHNNPQIGIKVINTPYTLDDPSSPQLALNTLFGILLGIVIVVIFYQTDKKAFFDFLRGLRKKGEPRENIFFYSQASDQPENDIEEINKFIQD